MAAATLGLGAVAGGAAPSGAAARAHPRDAPAGPPVLTQLVWQAQLPDAGNPIAQSSPTVADLDGQPSVVVGDESGYVWAFHLAQTPGTTDPTMVEGWPANVPAQGLCPDTSAPVPVDATPSVSTVDAPGATAPSVFVGSGSAGCPSAGGYQAFYPSGTLQWFTPVVEPPTDPQNDQGVQASMTVAPLTGSAADPDVVAGSLDQEEYALDGTTGATLPGWPFFPGDSVFSTAAVGDLYGTGHTEIVEGGASSAGFGRGQSYTPGGHFRILNATGGQICRADIDETIDSSPAIGGFLPGGATGAVVGTGAFYPGVSTENQVRAYTTGCQLAWATTLDGTTTSSPALADLEGNGQLQVAEATDTGSGGSVWALDAATGAVLWHEPTGFRVIGSVVTADLTGDGYQDVLVPTVEGLELFDGRTGDEVGTLAAPGDPGGEIVGLQNSALVTDDPDGSLGITIAGYGGATDVGYILHYEVCQAAYTGCAEGGQASDGSVADESGAWPMFHHDPQLTGDAGGLPAAGSVPACQVPSGALPGYDEVAADGGVFSFGAQPFCGSTGGLTLDAPVVAAARAPNTGGYWEVASDGGVFAYGGARYYGSMGGRPLNSPIVGMAATSDGAGYWLVAADGGIFAFGDAQFFGSMGGRHLNAPVVALMDDVNTGGYWMVGSDGGVFSFNAPYFGSTGSLTLAEPIVGAAPTDDGWGYRFVGSDGGVFTFGDATFSGSMGGRPLGAPMVSLIGP